MTTVTITQTFLTIVGEPIESIVKFHNIIGLVFVQVAGGQWRLYNTELNQCSRRRFDNLEAAYHFALTLCTVVGR